METLLDITRVFLLITGGGVIFIASTVLIALTIYTICATVNTRATGDTNYRAVLDSRTTQRRNCRFISVFTGIIGGLYTLSAYLFASYSFSANVILYVILSYLIFGAIYRFEVSRQKRMNNSTLQ